MSELLEAASEVHRFLSGQRIPYAIIGGIAVQRWGEPRFTRDVDVTILVSAGQEIAVLEKLLSFFTPRIANAIDFALQNRVCLLKSTNQCDVDVSLGLPGYEEEVTKRAVRQNLGKGLVFKICSAEDLIIHKAVAGRPQDAVDISGVILRQGRKLDVNYIRRWLKEFAFVLESTEVLERFERPWRIFMESKPKKRSRK